MVNQQVVLITGAATGIGRATALAFVDQGAQVFANHFYQEEDMSSLLMAARGASGKISAVAADVTDAGQVVKLFRTVEEAAGRLDVLVNNAGASLVKPFLETSESEWDNIIDTDLKSVFLCCKSAIPIMQKQAEGIIVNVSSELGFSGRENFTAYTAAKGGVITLTRSLAREFAPNIRVNGVAPGPTLTPLLEKENAVPGHSEAVEDIPLGRYARAEEIAQSILFLASTHAQFYCGDIISPTGGAFMR